MSREQFGYGRPVASAEVDPPAGTDQPADGAPLTGQRELLTSAMLKALAHPVRRRIVNVMNTGRPARATDLADRLGLPVNQVSFHLRTLARAGMVKEAPEHARDRRDRVWVAGGDNYSIAFPDEPVTGADAQALRAFLSQELIDQYELVRRVITWAEVYGTGQDAEPKGSATTGTLQLTAAQQSAVVNDLCAVLDRAKLIGSDPAEDEESSERAYLWDFSVLFAREDI